ncbi:MAG: hypothetical protein P8X52_02950, partial [Limibacillus sp.]
QFGGDDHLAVGQKLAGIDDDMGHMGSGPFEQEIFDFSDHLVSFATDNRRANQVAEGLGRRADPFGALVGFDIGNIGFVVTDRMLAMFSRK